jgi:hypothetical protein
MRKNKWFSEALFMEINMGMGMVTLDPIQCLG